MRAARSDSLRMVSSPRRNGWLEGWPFGQAFGPAENGRERVVQLVCDARDGLPERRHLFGLQQLVKNVAVLIIELLALADVAHERFEAQAAVSRWRVGARRHLDPH